MVIRTHCKLIKLSLQMQESISPLEHGSDERRASSRLLARRGNLQLHRHRNVLPLAVDDTCHASKRLPDGQLILSPSQLNISQTCDLHGCSLCAKRFGIRKSSSIRLLHETEASDRYWSCCSSTERLEALNLISAAKTGTNKRVTLSSVSSNEATAGTSNGPSSISSTVASSEASGFRVPYNTPTGSTDNMTQGRQLDNAVAEKIEKDQAECHPDEVEQGRTTENVRSLETLEASHAGFVGQEQEPSSLKEPICTPNLSVVEVVVSDVENKIPEYEDRKLNQSLRVSPLQSTNTSMEWDYYEPLNLEMLSLSASQRQQEKLKNVEHWV